MAAPAQPGIEPGMRVVKATKKRTPAASVAAREAAATEPLSSVTSRRGLMVRPHRRIGTFTMVQPQVRSTAISPGARRSTSSQVRDSRANSMTAWTLDAFRYANLIGEVGFVMNMKANAVASGALRIIEEAAALAVPGTAPTPGTQAADQADVETVDPRAERVMQAFVGPRGGLPELLRRAALHLSIAGESILLGMPTVDPDTQADLGIFWEFLSTPELVVTIQGDNMSIERKRDGTGKEKLDPDAVYTSRLWRSDPLFSDLPDSEMRRVLTVCAEVLGLTQMLDAAVKSRLAAGILFVPTEMSFAEEDDSDLDEDAEGDDGIDEFSEELLDHLKAPKDDPTSAAALVPLLMRGPAELGVAVKLIDLSRSIDPLAQQLRKEALDRLAAGLDVPPEIMKGKSGLSGLGGGNVAASIDDEFIAKHVQPLGDLIADFVTCAYLRPMLEEYEGLSVAEAARFRLLFDPTPAAAGGDATAAAALHEKDLLSDRAAVRSAGFDESDMPDDEELFIKRAWELITVAPQVYGPLLLNRIPGFEQVDISKMGAGPPGAPGGAPDPTGAPGPPALPPMTPSTGVPEGLIIRMATAADAALDRALDRAAARVVSHAAKDSAVKGRMATCSDKRRALCLLSGDDLSRLGLTSATLLAGAFDDLALQCARWTKDWLVGGGLQALEADDQANAVGRAVADLLDEFARAGFHTPLPLHDNGLRVPDELVLRAVNATSGLVAA